MSEQSWRSRFSTEFIVIASIALLFVVGSAFTAFVLATSMTQPAFGRPTKVPPPIPTRTTGPATARPDAHIPAGPANGVLPEPRRN